MAAMPLRTKIGLVIGGVMFALGAFIALKPLWSRDPVTQSRFLDLAFAIFFLVKGYLYLRQAWRRPVSPPPSASPGASTGQDGD